MNFSSVSFQSVIVAEMYLNSPRMSVAGFDIIDHK